MGSQRVGRDWATFTLLHLIYVNHPGIKRPQDPRVSNTTELTPAQATGPVQMGRDSMHSLTLGPWLKDDLSFTIGVSTIPRAWEGTMARHLLVLKTSTQKRHITSTPVLLAKAKAMAIPNCKGDREVYWTVCSEGGTQKLWTHGCLKHHEKGLTSHCLLWVLTALQSSIMNTICCLDAQSCPTICDRMDCSLPGSSVHGILQAKILKWVAISSSRGSSRSRDQTHISYTGRRILYHWAMRKAQYYYCSPIQHIRKPTHKEDKGLSPGHDLSP